MCAFLSHTPACSVIVCVKFCWRRVGTESCYLRTLYAFASMILRTARFLCVIYAEIRVNATAGLEQRDCYDITIICNSGIPPLFQTQRSLDTVNYRSGTSKTNRRPNRPKLNHKRRQRLRSATPSGKVG